MTTPPDTSAQKSNSNSRLLFHEFKRLKEDNRAKKIKETESSQRSKNSNRSYGGTRWPFEKGGGQDSSTDGSH